MTENNETYIEFSNKFHKCEMSFTPDRRKPKAFPPSRKRIILDPKYEKYMAYRRMVSDYNRQIRSGTPASDLTVIRDAITAKVSELRAEGIVR